MGRCVVVAAAVGIAGGMEVVPRCLVMKVTMMLMVLLMMEIRPRALSGALPRSLAVLAKRARLDNGSYLGLGLGLGFPCLQLGGSA